MNKISESKPKLELEQETSYILWLPKSVEEIVLETAEQVGIPELPINDTIRLVFREALETYIGSVRKGNFRKPRLDDVKGIVLNFPEDFDNPDPAS